MQFYPILNHCIFISHLYAYLYFYLAVNKLEMWKIFAGLCVRRPAIVSPTLTPLQLQMQNFYANLEIQKSHLSSHELRHRNDLERIAQMARDQQSDGIHSSSNSRRQPASGDSASSLLTAKDMELSWESDEKEFWNEIGKLGLCCFSFMALRYL